MEVDYAELEAQLNQMTPEELKKQLLDAKVKQRIATKKYYNPETAKKARDKKSAMIKAQADAARKLPATDGKSANLYEQIMAEASRLADEKLGESEAEEQAA